MAHNFEAADQLPPYVSYSLQRAMASRRADERLVALGAANKYDKAHISKRRHGLLVLSAFMHREGHSLLLPKRGPEESYAYTANERIKVLVNEVATALGPHLGPAATIGEMLVQGSDELYVTHNFSDAKGFTSFGNGAHRPTPAEPYLILISGNGDAQANMEAALISIGSA